ncbi:GerAB/ArcD/ProY family transporter [Bacillus sp. N3536]|nr:GerAB/ArcD/ProY family transporter [Bacillus sp. N3536]
MKSSIKISQNEMLNAFLLFFVIHSAQIGVGVQGFQRVVYQDAKHDAWISVIIAGLATHIVVFFMIKTLELYGSNDLYGIHQDVYGKSIGNLLNATYLIYCSFAFFSILRNYIEVIQTWIFPGLGTWFISSTLLLIVIYAFTGGLRVIVGVSFFSVILSLWLLPILTIPLEYSTAANLLPILETKISSILKGAHSMTFTIIGFEILYSIYPYIKEKEKVKKHAHLALLATTLVYLSIMLVSITYYSEGKLLKTVWATLTLFSFISFPFVERFEYVAVCYWMLIIIPNLCFYVWAAYRATTRIVKISGSKFVWLFSFVALIGTLVVQSRIQINSFNNEFAKYAFYIVFVYPIFLYLVAVAKKKFTTKKEQEE